MKTLTRWLLTLGLLGILLLLGAREYLYWWAGQPQPQISDFRLQVANGQSLIALANRLQQTQGLNARLWVAYARLEGKTLIKTGEYQVSAGISPAELLRLLHAGLVIQYRAQLLEGWTYAEALAHLQSLDNLDIRLKGLQWPAQKQLLQMTEDHPEGWFFPDTYLYQKGDSDVSILRRAHEKMQQQLAALWQQRAAGLPYRDAYEALIMASIVEKETAIDAEREQIAGVFVRRLQKGMRLQTDPTVIYGMGTRYRGNLRRSDLSQPTAYNTYVIKGLPPTPIALPGQRSIYAALHPDDGASLYFVAKGDGYHQFSETLQAHNEAVNRYQKKRPTNYRSTPDPQGE